MTDDVLDTMAALEAVLDANARRAGLVRDRMGVIRARRAQGGSYRTILAEEDRPLIAELLTLSSQALDSVGAQVRRSEALALHREGLTMDEIAGVFGVSRQRISTLLREARATHRA